jgi:GH24 family phage-related lysozyme (muramidase)
VRQSQFPASSLAGRHAMRSVIASGAASGPSRRLRLRTVFSVGSALAVALAASAAMGPAADAVSALPAGASACARLAADPPAAPCLGANSVTKAWEDTMRRMEAEGGKPRLTPYNDNEDDIPDGTYDEQKGNCTIGIGHLIHHGPCTDADHNAEEWKDETPQKLIDLYNHDVESFEHDLNEILIERLHLTLDPCQYNALLDLYFNGGPSWFEHKNGKLTNLTKKLAAGDMQAAADTLQDDVAPGLTPAQHENIANRRKTDADEFRSEHCPCKYPPVSGSISGTVSFPASGYGFLSGNVTWSGRVDYSKQVENVPAYAEYDATSGTIGWAFTPTGTLPSGCSWTVTSGTLSDPGPPSLAGVNFVALYPHVYYAQLGAFSRGFSDGLASSEYSCANGTGPPANYLVDMDVEFQTTSPSLAYKNGKLTGSTSSNHGADGTSTWKWDLSFDSLPPVTP